MRIILLSGGSGTRLWPLSNSIISKQFLSILPTDNGSYESMVQRVYRQVKNYTDEKIVIVAPECQRDIINLQLGDDVELVLEPTRKGTYNAIKLACSRIVKQVSPNKIKKTDKRWLTYIAERAKMRDRLAELEDELNGLNKP